LEVSDIVESTRRLTNEGNQFEVTKNEKTQALEELESLNPRRKAAKVFI
jgi:hypothetical protein